MRATRDIMGMPATIELRGEDCGGDIEQAFEYLRSVDATFSTYRDDSEIMRFNRGELLREALSSEVQEILELAERTKAETDGYFDIEKPDGSIDPSGIVKGWAINNAAKLLRSLGHEDLYVEVAGDIQTSGKDAEGKNWRIGIRNPFKHDEIVKVVEPRGKGIATSGTAARGAHIYDPHTKQPVKTNVASLTVIGPDVYEADRFATAAFAMGERGIAFIGTLEGFEGYQIDANGTATMTQGFVAYTV